MIKKPALGRGLSALIPASRASEIPPAGQQVHILPVDQIDAGHRQPRKRFADAGLTELAESIKSAGILQPILVTKNGTRYRILAGERRFRAARLAGLSEIPVLVRDGLEDRDHLLLALVENIQREDLTPLEEADAYRQLRDELGMTQEDIAQRVGKDRATIANTLRLLKLPATVKAALEEGQLTAGHARALLMLPSAADQETLTKEITQKGLSVRMTEARVAEMLGETRQDPAKPVKDPHTKDAEQRLQRALATRVEILRKKKGGEIKISFYSEQQLIGLFEKIVGEDG